MKLTKMFVLAALLGTTLASDPVVTAADETSTTT
jgi:hypothetical protein